MSRRCWSPWCFPFGGWLHFWRVWLTVFLQDCRVVILVSKLQCSYQTAASAATPSSLFLTTWTISLMKLYYLAALPDVSALCVQLLVCVQSGPQIFFNLVFWPRSTPPRASRSRLALSTLFFTLSPLFTLALPSPALCFVRLSFLDGSTV